MNKEKKLETMRLLRNKRDIEILEKELEEINLDVDYKKDIIDNKVLNVKYLGSIEWDKKDNDIKDIYLLIEQIKNKNGSLIQIERYYTNDLEFLAGNNLNDRFELLLDTQYINNKELLDKLKELDKQGLLDLNELEEKRITSISEILKVKQQDIKGLTEFNKEEIEEAEFKIHNNQKEEKDLSKKEVDQILSKTEIDTHQKVTDKDTISSMLGIENKGYKKISIVYTDKLQNTNNTTRFSFVGIKEDGSAEKIDTLEQGYGNNPSKKIDSLNRDGSEVKQKQVSSIYKIKGKDEEQISVNFGIAGTIDVSLVRTPNQDNQQAISIPIETHSIRPTTREVRELMNENRNPRVKEEINRINAHRENECDNTNIKDINDNPYDNTHNHIESDSNYIEKCTDEILKDEDIQEIFTRKEVKESLLYYINNNVDKRPIEDVIEEVKYSKKQDAINMLSLQKNKY